MHRRVHEWLAASGATEAATSFTGLNARVYTELFETPASDPWLGLRTPDVWDAIDETH